MLKHKSFRPFAILFPAFPSAIYRRNETWSDDGVGRWVLTRGGEKGEETATGHLHDE